MLIIKLLEQMMSRKIFERPNCEDVLRNYPEWSLKITQVFEDDKARVMRKSLENDIPFDESYYLFFI
jgi:hypothetical protein